MRHKDLPKKILIFVRRFCNNNETTGFISRASLQIHALRLVADPTLQLTVYSHRGCGAP